MSVARFVKRVSTLLTFESEEVFTGKLACHQIGDIVEIILLFESRLGKQTSDIMPWGGKSLKTVLR